MLKCQRHLLLEFVHRHTEPWEAAQKVWQQLGEAALFLWLAVRLYSGTELELPCVKLLLIALLRYSSS